MADASQSLHLCTSGVMGRIGLIVFSTSSLGDYITNSTSQITDCATICLPDVMVF